MDNPSFGAEKHMVSQILAEEKSCNDVQLWVKTKLLLSLNLQPQPLVATFMGPIYEILVTIDFAHEMMMKPCT
jgi:hypothetical protein